MAFLGQQPLIVGVSIAMLIIATLSEIFRFLSRYATHTDFWWDDWCSLVAMILSYSLNIVQFVCVKCNLGRHTNHISNPAGSIKCFLMALYTVTQFYALCMPAIKLSMVLFYWRLFGSSPKMRKALIFAAGMLVAWTIGALFSGIFQCDPIARAWNKELPGHCINTVVYFRAIASTNLITDVFILVLPVPIVWGLNRPIGERAALIAIFGLGTFVSIISIVRIVLLTPPNDPDPLWDGTQGTVWTAVETSVGVVCVNLPSMAPLFRRYILRHDIVTSSRSGGSSYPSARKPGYGTGSSSRRRGSLDSMNPLGTEQELTGSQRDIFVTRDYNVTRDTNGHVELDEMASPTVNPPGETIAWHDKAPTRSLSQEFAILRP